MKQGKANIHIGRTHCSSEPDYYTIEIIDENSSVLVVEAQLTLEQFARALSSESLMDVPVEYGPLDKVGKYLEVKTEYIEDIDYSNFTIQLPIKVKPFEVDGWKADKETTFNCHRRSSREGKNVYSVNFRRWVDNPPPPKPKMEFSEIKEIKNGNKRRKKS